MTTKDRIKKEVKHFKNMFTKNKCNCGNGITINMITISEQDLETLLVRIINLIKIK